MQKWKKIKYLQKVQRREELKNAQRSLQVNFWTVFMVGGRRRCLENICVHNHLKYHVWYF